MEIKAASLSTGITLEYALTGPDEADTLCFVHGLGSNLRQFTVQAAHFSDRYRVLLLSLRGHGGSSSSEPATPISYATSFLAQDVAALLDHLGIERLHYVGNSLGVLVGYELLKLGHPRLLSLTTFGTTAELHSPRLTYWLVVGLVRLLGVNGVAGLIGRSTTKDRVVGAQLTDLYRQTSREALLFIPQHIANYNYTELLRRAQLPLLLIQGALDKGITQTLDTTLAALAEANNARVVPLADAGHFANMEQPAAFNELLATFLTEAVMTNHQGEA